MRRRLLLVLLPLLTALLTALEVPLMQAYADGLTQELYAEHLAEAEDFAVFADPVLRSDRGGESLRQEIRAYIAVSPGVAVSIYDNEEARVVTAGAPPSPASAAARERFLVDRAHERPKTVWPWRRERMIVGEAVGKRGPEIGAVVIEVPTDAVRDKVEVRMAVLAGGGLAVLLLTGALCALPLARWVLRPVHDLNAAAGRLAAGGLGARASDRGGPPELRGLARAFNEMADNLVTALQRQRAFVADASHELRNPLATLRLRLEALAGETSEDVGRDARLALSEADRLAAIVDRLLELARAEATAAEQVDFDAVAVVSERLAAWAPALGAEGIVARVQAPEPAIARGLPDAVRYALDVALDNARKFAPGHPLDVEVRSRGGHVEISVRDHGAGLHPDELDQVGDRFWRSSGHRATAGTGLGLATSRALLESAGATLEISLGRPGLVVTLAVPASTGAILDTSARRPDADPADTSSVHHAG